MPPPPSPLKLKKSSSSTQTLTTTATSAQDARLLVRETLRISASLASSEPNLPPLDTQTHTPRNQLGLLHHDQDFVSSSFRLICCEEIDGRRWNYVAEPDSSPGTFKKGSLRALGLHSPQPPLDGLMSFVRSYVVPEGFPDSVIPSYVPYMTWRALKHFFGGAMGVFTTQTLLNSVGVSRNTAAPGAVAINWILKDGAGRVGKMLFARQGKKFDYDLKQLRFAGDLLMELGAGVELATAAVPHLFLPLACAANVAKNVAAVTSTSTRTPIYKAFAKGENIGDVTAKGECVGNIADLVKSVVLHTLNRARFSVAVDAFLKTGRVPSLQEGNLNENVFRFPWLKEGPVVLGPRFKDAFQEPNVYLAMEPLFEKERYVVTYNPKKGKVYALFKDQAKSDDILKAAFHAQVLLHFMHLSFDSQHLSQKEKTAGYLNFEPTAKDLEACIVESCKMVSTSYGIFKSKAAEQGWMMSEAHLNPGRARLIK
ncbi:PREDICTED: protein root UVB sensitive 6 isoform X2 [Prunus mume]|uniref:Protein root UVB sensitive 6 isoform X2 n=1 Tax=Prunus mume TaxID=102107 RepID=A0ABM1LL29_PRUMU|nr:PREDICTED: protein root UVB sensitive 6 isoform X2 [Prunus mume]